ncbi:MAG: hypothetical protein ACE15F_14650 [bacterium]
MTASLRSCWKNCAVAPDPEIERIDRMEDELIPLSPGVAKIRELISCLEMCHHKAGRWIDNVLAAIASGESAKGLGTRAPDQVHPVENIWQNACAALMAWCAGCPAASLDMNIGPIPASQLLDGLGPRSPLKEWQTQRVAERIRSCIHWPRSGEDPSSQYRWILYNPAGTDAMYFLQCPDYYREQEEFWLATARTILQDRIDGHPAEISLGLAIDMLWPCHWRFIDNLRIVLDAIGGRLQLDTPYAACGRNIGLLPTHDQMAILSHTLFYYAMGGGSGEQADPAILARLGESSAVKSWLAASLGKTIRLQINPPADIIVLSALEGPDWIRE